MRKTRTKRCECQARVNIRLTSTGMYRLTSVILTHTHPAFFDDHLPLYKPPSQEQKDLVDELAPLKTLGRQDIHRLLTSRFPDHPLNIRQVTNLINNARTAARNRVQDSGGDMVAMVDLLVKLKEADEQWVIGIDVDPETRKFRQLFWMSPGQVDLARRFGDVIINDITYQRNKYGLPLNIWMVIDHQFKSRNIAYALHTSETVEDHEWALDQLFKILPPRPHKERVFVSDNDLALARALNKYGVHHILCIQHLSGNLAKNLAPLLGALFQSFQDAFWQVYHSISPSVFEEKWKRLLLDFPRAQEYLQRVLWPTREQWAWPWISVHFTCGVRTSGRVESENKVNKLFADSKTGLLDLIKSLIARTDQQAEAEVLQARQVCGVICPRRIFSVFV